jgi:hypothetical protein
MAIDPTYFRNSIITYVMRIINRIASIFAKFSTTPASLLCKNCLVMTKGR